jgi:hypothetical protein
MSLTKEDKDWLEEKLGNMGLTLKIHVNDEIQAHENVFHPPHTNGVSKVGKVVSIIAASVGIMAACLGGLLWLITHAK